MTSLSLPGVKAQEQHVSAVHHCNQALSMMMTGLSLPGVTAQEQHVSAVHQHLQQHQEGLRPDHCGRTLQGAHNLHHKVLPMTYVHTDTGALPLSKRTIQTKQITQTSIPIPATTTNWADCSSELEISSIKRRKHTMNAWVHS